MFLAVIFHLTAGTKNMCMFFSVVHFHIYHPASKGEHEFCFMYTHIFCFHILLHFQLTVGYVHESHAHTPQCLLLISFRYSSVLSFVFFLTMVLKLHLDMFSISDMFQLISSSSRSFWHVSPQSPGEGFSSWAVRQEWTSDIVLKLILMLQWLECI